MPDCLPWDQISNTQPLNLNKSPDYEASHQSPVLIIGAGLAGCWMARTLAEQNVQVAVLEAGERVANAASSNPVGMFKPYVTRADSHAMQFYLEAHRCLLHRLHQWQLYTDCDCTVCGVLQLVETPYPDSAHYECVHTSNIEPTYARNPDTNALLFDEAGWLNPRALCKALLAHPNISVRCQHKVANIHKVADIQAHEAQRWRITIKGKPDLITEHLILSTGVSTAIFGVSDSLSTIPARGQISRFRLQDDTPNVSKVLNGRSYVIPDGSTVVVGATFERHLNDASVRRSDDVSNLAALQATVPGLQVQVDAIEAYAGVRATTPDRLPMVGPAPDSALCANLYADIHHGRHLDTYLPLPVHKGLYVLAGLGSRGIVTAPFAASLLSDYILGGHAIEPWMPLVNPARFQIRQLKRSAPKQ